MLPYPPRPMAVLQELLDRFTYAGILLVLLLGVHRVEHWVALAALIAVTGVALSYAMRWNRRTSKTRERL